MSKLNLQLLQSLQEALHRPPYLDRGDFQVSEQEYSKGVFLTILYYLKDGRYFKAAIPYEESEFESSQTKAPGFGYIPVPSTQREYRIRVDLCPGEILQNQEISLYSLDKLVPEIRAWAVRLVEEIRNDPLNRILEEQQKQIAKIEQIVAQYPNEPVSQEEAAKIKEVLEGLIADLRDKVAGLEDQGREQAEKIEELAEQLEIIKQRVDTLPKKGMVRAILTRLYNWTSDPKVGQLADNAQKVIGLLSGNPPGS